jgi:hypothetical protein
MPADRYLVVKFPKMGEMKHEQWVKMAGRVANRLQVIYGKDVTTYFTDDAVLDREVTPDDK